MSGNEKIGIYKDSTPLEELASEEVDVCKLVEEPLELALEEEESDLDELGVEVDDSEEVEPVLDGTELTSLLPLLPLIEESVTEACATLTVKKSSGT